VNSGLNPFPRSIIPISSGIHVTMKLSDKVAFVTGGNSEIGLATATRFVAEGSEKGSALEGLLLKSKSGRFGVAALL